LIGTCLFKNIISKNVFKLRERKERRGESRFTSLGKKPWSSAVVFNLFEVAEPKMTSKNFAEPKMTSENFAEPKLPLIIFVKPK
jgi:hypothetical protein